MAKLSLSGLSRRYAGAERAALDGFDLEVEDGETVALVGPSGCGKSTTLRLVAGLDDPDRGTITLGGRDLSGVAPQDRDVAMVFQGYALYPHMSVRENIGFPLKMRGLDPGARKKKVEDAAELLGIGKLLDRLPGELSGGERQRVAMGRAIVRSPKLFLFDEPLSNLDAALRQTLRVEIAKLLRRVHATAIYVTHDQVEAMTVGDRVVVMQGGRIEQADRPRVVYERPRSLFVAGFLGTPAINLFELAVKGGAVQLGASTLPLPPAARDLPRVTIAVRPEHVRVTSSDDLDAAPALAFEAKVVATEPLGAETILHLEGPVGAEPRFELRAEAPGFFDRALSSSVRVLIERAHVRFFDPASGLALEAEAP